MTGYFIALVVGLVLAVASRVAFWGDLRRAERLRAEPHVGLLAPALFVSTISVVLVLVGLLGVQHEAAAGHQPPVPLSIIGIVVAVGIVALLASRQRRRSQRRRAQQQRARQRAEKEQND